ncbi:MAG: patatin-like phospholipase family protein [Spirochaetales bacterium]|nr:patatin-like phospholipase family protein [Spirochaetales bacterium]
MNFPGFRKKAVKILSIDGGGIRGYIPALILEELSAFLDQESGNGNLFAAFDIIAGTSSGSLTALGIAAPNRKKGNGGYGNKPEYTMTDIVNIYETCRTDIFPERTLDRLGMVKQAFHEKYDSSGLEKVLEGFFEERTMKDCLTNVLIASFDILSNKPVIISNDDDFYMKDVSRASSAAPTFFEPAVIESISKEKKYCMIDGAMAANNPAMFAYIKARIKFPRADKFIIFSIGTGQSKSFYNYEQIKNWGFVDWILPSNGTPIYSIMSRARESCVTMQLSNIPGVEYYRINPFLEGESLEIDNVSFENMKRLKATAEKVIEKNKDLLKKLAIYLT